MLVTLDAQDACFTYLCRPWVPKQGRARYLGIVKPVVRHTISSCPTHYLCSIGQGVLHCGQAPQLQLEVCWRGVTQPLASTDQPAMYAHDEAQISPAPQTWSLSLSWLHCLGQHHLSVSVLERSREPVGHDYH